MPELVWVSRWQVVKGQMLLAASGKPVKDRHTVQKYMERLASFCRRKNNKGQLTYYVTLGDIEKWNNHVKKSLDKFKVYDPDKHST